MGASKEEKRAKSADAISEYNLKKETRPVCSEDIPISKNKLLIIWNTLFPTSPIVGQTTDDEVTFRNIIIPYGEQATIENVLTAVSKVFREGEKGFYRFKDVIKSTIEKDREDACLYEVINLGLGYLDEQTIYFKRNDYSSVEGVLNRRFSSSSKKLYGMNFVDEKGNNFYDAFEVVYGKDGELIFEGVAVDWAKPNYFNFCEHIEEEQEDPIDENETDPRLIALKKAIDAYNLDSRNENLEQVKVEWLRKLKGNASLPKKADLTKLVNDDSNSPISDKPIITKTTPDVIDNSVGTDDMTANNNNNKLVQSGTKLAKTYHDYPQVDYDSILPEDLIENNSDLPSLKKSFSAWIISLLIVGISIIVVVSVLYLKRKKRIDTK